MRTSISLLTVVALAAVAGPTLLPAQDSTASSARAAIAQLRVAVRSGDWQQISPFLPASGAWTDVVRGMVARQDTSGYSFWRRDSELLADSVQIVVMGEGQVAASGPFRVGGQVGFWGAVLHLRAGHWQLECTSEQFGRRAWQAPYCLAPRH